MCGSIVSCAQWTVAASVNPDTVKAQMEGGINFGLTAALKTEITFENGRVQQSNFNDYPMLRMFEAPIIEVFIVPSEEKPTGVGEPSVSPWRPRSRTRFSPQPESVSGGCQFAPVTSSRREGPTRELPQQISRSAIALCTLPACLMLTGIFSTANSNGRPKPDVNASQAAFLEVYKVLISPRCQNCHPAGDAPLQGDDSHVHI